MREEWGNKTKANTMMVNKYKNRSAAYKHAHMLGGQEAGAQGWRGRCGNGGGRRERGPRQTRTKECKEEGREKRRHCCSTALRPFAWRGDAHTHTHAHTGAQAEAAAATHTHKTSCLRKPDGRHLPRWPTLDRLPSSPHHLPVWETFRWVGRVHVFTPSPHLRGILAHQSFGLFPQPHYRLRDDGLWNRVLLEQRNDMLQTAKQLQPT